MNTNSIQHPITEQSVTTEGITADYVWYQSEQMIVKMNAWQTSWKVDFKRLIQVMEDRHAEHLKMIDGLLHENKALREKLKEKKNES
jgi:hypothetical protein